MSKLHLCWKSDAVGLVLSVDLFFFRHTAPTLKPQQREKKHTQRVCDLCAVSDSCSRGSRDLLRLDMVEVRGTVRRLAHVDRCTKADTGTPVA